MRRADFERAKEIEEEINKYNRLSLDVFSRVDNETRLYLSCMINDKEVVNSIYSAFDEAKIRLNNYVKNRKKELQKQFEELGE